jgi:glyoxylate/hydroxypyruvate reductase A
MLTLLYAGADAQWPLYETALPDAVASLGLDAKLTREADPKDVDYIIYAPNGPISDFTPFENAKAVLSLWAGVEKIVGNETLTQPLCRMVDRGLAEGMVEYVLGHVLRGHLGMGRHLLNPDAKWEQIAPPLARDRKLVVLGLGELGTACARMLKAINFNVHGWSRSEKTAARSGDLDALQGVILHHGPDGLETGLQGADIVVTLLPDTHETLDLMNAERLALLAPGAHLINPGRGVLVDDTALLAALDSGQIGHATLDVFRTEPLPPEHPYWSDPKVTVTPHIAAETRVESASEVIAQNIRRFEAGEPPLYLVDRALGY